MEQKDEHLEQNPPVTPSDDDRPKTSVGKRILAWIGVFLMIFLVIMYTYSIATGKIFLW